MSSEQLYFVFFAKDDGLVVRQFLTLEAAMEGCDELSDRYVTCIVPVSVDEQFCWNGKVKAEYSVKALRDDLMVAHALDAAGVELDTQSQNTEGRVSLGRNRRRNGGA